MDPATLAQLQLDLAVGLDALHELIPAMRARGSDFDVIAAEMGALYLEQLLPVLLAAVLERGGQPFCSDRAMA